MEFTREKENFYRIMSLLHDCILPQLREYFIQKWNGQPGKTPWCDSKENGKELLGKMTKGARRDALIKDRISGGQTGDWDLTCVFKALLVFEENMDKAEEDGIKILKDVRNTMSHLSGGKCDDEMKDEHFKEVKGVYDALGWPKTDVDEIENKELTTEKMKQLKAKLENEKRAGRF